MTEFKICSPVCASCYCDLEAVAHQLKVPLLNLDGNHDQQSTALVAPLSFEHQ